MLAYSHIAHDCRVEEHVIFSNNTTLAGHVEVEEYAIIGGLTAVHQFCRIGQHSICGGCTKIVQDVPPYMIADGNPAEIRGINLVGLERRGFAAELIRILKESYRILYRSNLNTKQAIAELQMQFGGVEPVQQLIQFIERSQRGIIRSNPPGFSRFRDCANAKAPPTSGTPSLPAAACRANRSRYTCSARNTWPK